MPKDMPDKIHRRNYDNFCIRCTRCDAKEDNHPCYVRCLNHWYVHRTLLERPVSCGHCNVEIPEGKRAFVQKFYAWPDSTKETVSEDTEASTGGSVPGISFVAKESSVGKWHSLSNDMQNKLKNAGLGNGRGGARTAMEAEQFYESSIPFQVRNGGESAVKDLQTEGSPQSKTVDGMRAISSQYITLPPKPKTLEIRCGRAPTKTAPGAAAT